MMRESRFDEKIFTKAVKALNAHLPGERKTLFVLLNEDKPAVQGRDQSIHRIKREELEEIARLLPVEEHKNLRLPIYIELTADYGRGIARIQGRLDCKLARRILEEGREESEEQREEESEKGDEIFIYRDDVRRLRRKMPTTTEYAFFYSTS